MGTRTIIARRGEAPRRPARLWLALGLAAAVFAVALGALAASRRGEERGQGASAAHGQGIHMQRAGEWRLYDYPRAAGSDALRAQRAGERRPGYAPRELGAALQAQRAGERGQAKGQTGSPAGWDAYRAGERSPGPR